MTASTSSRTLDDSNFDPALRDVGGPASSSGSGTRASARTGTVAAGASQQTRQSYKEDDVDDNDNDDEEDERMDTSMEDAIETTPKQLRSKRASSVATTSTVATPSPAKGKKAAAAASNSKNPNKANASANNNANGLTSPTVFHAVYSNVPVYEIMARGIGVMRRRSDSWINATQLLKVAGIGKAQRTKILDRDIAGSGGVIPYEKIQGGYGRYQGTWIPFHEAAKVADEYGILELIQPLLDYQAAPAATQPPLAGMNSSTSSNSAPTGQAGSEQQRQPANVANLQRQRTSQKQQLDQAMQSAAGSPSSASNMPNGQSVFGMPQEPSQQPSTSGQQVNSTTSGRKRARSDLTRSTNGNDGNASELAPVPIKRLKMTTVRTGEDLYKLHRATKNTVDPQTINIEHRNLLMSLFIPDASGSSEAVGPSSSNQDIEPTNIIASFPDDLDPDTPIDDHMHTALHWAAALARISTAKALIECGADPSRGNGMGETPLMRAVLVTNNFDSETFAPLNGSEGLLSLLAPSIRTTDDADRTVLHHIALVAGIKGRSAAARHYMESILDWIITTEDASDEDIQTFLNAQDANGDTALNIAARVGSRPIVRMLLESGVDSLIPNKLGLRAGDFGLLDEGLQLPTEGEMAVDNVQNDTPRASTSNLPVDPATNQPISSTQQSASILETLQTLLSTYSTDFQNELSSRSESLERTRNELFIATKELKDQRAQVAALKEKVRAVELSKWRIKNLERALEEEDRFDWTGRSTVGGEPAFSDKTATAEQDTDDQLAESSLAVQKAAFEHRGANSTLGALAAVNMPKNIEADPPLPASAGPSSPSASPTDSKPPSASASNGQTQLTLAQLRRMVVWYTRIIALLKERIEQTEENVGEMELDARKVVKLCTGVQEDEDIENMLSNLINALQSDAPGGTEAANTALDLQRVSAFMAKVRSQELA
ncbi:hypothetical protein P389DRAFT_107116 [Cystobasidium minutum MCA 4210]|uniref:uncharacterized protein n=1 Tax=Cystobasidium minutum MCA 4210 TaxID=1397322 RepID=UPI0034CF64DA|eukprot:jgi/Rhomi1/107116/CE107115_1054